MSASTDRILDLIDAGLQTSAEGGMSVGDPDSCARCLMRPRSGQSEFCSGCRAHLLGDAAADETVGQRTVTLPVPRAVRSHMEEFIDRMTDALLAGASWPFGPPPDGAAAAEAVFVDGCLVMHTRWLRPSETCITGPPRDYRIPFAGPVGITFAEEGDPHWTGPAIEAHDYTLAGTMDRPDGMARHVYARR